MRTLTLDIETIPVDLPPDWDKNKFPPLACHQPVVVSMMVSEADKIKLQTYSADQSDGWEQSMLLAFNLELRSPTRLVTWNGHWFDVPLLVLRALKHKVVLSNLQGIWGSRYKDHHFDMKDRLGQFAGRQGIHLEGVAKLLDLPGKHDIDGGKVNECWARGEYARVRTYCEEDVIQTYLIYLRYVQVMQGHDTSEKYDRVRQAFLERLAVAGKLGIQAFEPSMQP